MFNTQLTESTWRRGRKENVYNLNVIIRKFKIRKILQSNGPVLFRNVSVTKGNVGVMKGFFVLFLQFFWRFEMLSTFKITKLKRRKKKEQGEGLAVTAKASRYSAVPRLSPCLTVVSFF